MRTSLLEIRIETGSFSAVVRGEPDRRVADFPVWVDLRTVPTAAVGFLDPDYPQATAVVCTALAAKLRLRPDQVNMRVASLGHCWMAGTPSATGPPR